ncbi:hypothetical protein PP178_04000 [Zeaxanthinibacter sp. PT1]|uniref:hypothetical protein n=1 Tax=Zeaxanthinibacter TaxID=561554 RepID=UPI0023493BAB|nr:hypothetical protein [Zeaxanthinibacter sp. PT1]MDC6350703.1 hypothetical protein [Zeaxanthinibacter sp. PT1]
MIPELLKYLQLPQAPQGDATSQQVPNYSGQFYEMLPMLTGGQQGTNGFNYLPGQLQSPNLNAQMPTQLGAAITGGTPAQSPMGGLFGNVKDFFGKGGQGMGTMGGAMAYAGAGQLAGNMARNAFAGKDKIVSKTEGKIAGALKGAGTGAAIGSVIPGVGTAIGAVGGALVGGLTGQGNRDEIMQDRRTAYNDVLDRNRIMDHMQGGNILNNYSSYGVESSGYMEYGGIVGPTTHGKKRQLQRKSEEQIKRERAALAKEAVANSKKTREKAGTRLFATGGKVDPGKKKEQVSSGLGTNLIRRMLPMPLNASQMVASMATGDNKFSTRDADVMTNNHLYRSVENAIKRSGKKNGGTEYNDYSPAVNRDINSLRMNAADMAAGSLISPELKAATTFGRVSYRTNPDTGEVEVYDSYDFSKTPKTGGVYGNIRNTAGEVSQARGIKEQAQLIGKFTPGEWAPGLNPASLANTLSNPFNLIDVDYDTIKKVSGTASRIGNRAMDAVEDFGDDVYRTGRKAYNTVKKYIPFENGGSVPADYKVEGGEVMQVPQGAPITTDNHGGATPIAPGMVKFQGDKHSAKSGGIGVQGGEGGFVFSDKLKTDPKKYLSGL